MNKKAILSLALTGCILTSTVHPAIGSKKILVKLAKGIRTIFRGSGKVWKGFKKVAPTAAKITAGLAAYYFLTKPIDSGFKKIIDKFPNFLKKFFKDPKKGLLGDKHIASEPVKVDFTNPNDFAPGSIDLQIAKLRKKIRRKKLTNNQNVKRRIKIPRLILFHGKTQVGKSHSAEALAKELGAKKIIRLPASRIVSKYYGESSEVLTDIYEEAKSASDKNNPVVIILEEIDGPINKKHADIHGVYRQITETLQHIRDEILKKDVNVYIMATTNFFEELPDAIVSRFEADGGTIEVKSPNRQARKHILRQEAEKEDLEVEEAWLEKKADETNGCHIGKLKNIITKINDEYLEAQEQDEDLQLDKSIDEIKEDKSIINKIKNKIKPVLQPVTKAISSFASKAKTYVHSLLSKIPWFPWKKKEEEQRVKIRYIEENNPEKQNENKKKNKKSTVQERYLKILERRALSKQKSHHIVKAPKTANNFPSGVGYQLGSDNQEVQTPEWAKNLKEKHGKNKQKLKQKARKNKFIEVEEKLKPYEKYRKKPTFNKHKFCSIL